MALQAGYKYAKLVYTNPAAEQVSQGFIARNSQYDLLWAYYENSIFDMADTSWAQFRSDNGLYRATRSIYNPTKRLVDFYASNVYPGALSEDGKPLPKGRQTAIPFSKDTNDKLKKAIAQFWQWSSWQSEKTVQPRWGAILGEVLYEIVDDVERGKVYARHIWPGFVADLELDSMGNVKRYVIEYNTCDAKGISYTYRVEVDKFFYLYFRDGEPYDYDGKGAVQPNPYGFAPAVWFPHVSAGGPHGQPAAHGLLAKINELNSLASQINDYIGKRVDTPVLFTTPSGANVSSVFNNTKRGRTGVVIDEFGNTRPDFSDRENVLMLKAPTGTDVKPLVSDLDVAGAMTSCDRILSEIEADTPEIAFWTRIREMQQLTGPAVERSMGDVKAKLGEAAAQYDRGNVALFGMAVAIGGWRLSQGIGGWANPTAQQLKFKGFDLNSYARGKLEMVIEPRELVPVTDSERNQERMTYYQAVKAGTDAGFPFEFVIKDDVSEEELTQIAELKQQKLAKQQQIFAQQPGGMMNDTGRQTSADQPANPDSQNAGAVAPAQQARQTVAGGNGPQGQGQAA